MNDPKNIAGIGNLIPVEDPSLAPEIIKLEQDIIRGARIEGGDDIDAAQEYKEEMSRLSNNFMLNHNEDIAIDQTNTSISAVNDDIATNDSYVNDTPKQNTFTTTDPTLQRITIEEQKQRRINTVLNDVEDDELGIDIDKDREEDEKANLLEQIDLLRDTLEDDGVNLSSVPIVFKNNSVTDIRNVHKMLRLKNDRNRYCSFAEEMILAGAYGIEYLFDGDKEWFGRKPDLVGWPETVKVKLRRMRYDTSMFVQEIMSEYSISSGMRLLIELLPSAFLYSRKRKTSHNDTIMHDIKKNQTKKDNSYSDAITNLNNIC